MDSFANIINDLRSYGNFLKCELSKATNHLSPNNLQNISKQKNSYNKHSVTKENSSNTSVSSQDSNAEQNDFFFQNRYFYRQYLILMFLYYEKSLNSKSYDFLIEILKITKNEKDIYPFLFRLGVHLKQRKMINLSLRVFKLLDLYYTDFFNFNENIMKVLMNKDNNELVKIEKNDNFKTLKFTMTPQIDALVDIHTQILHTHFIEGKKISYPYLIAILKLNPSYRLAQLVYCQIRKYDQVAIKYLRTLKIDYINQYALFYCFYKQKRYLELESILRKNRTNNNQREIYPYHLNESYFKSQQKYKFNRLKDCSNVFDIHPLEKYFFNLHAVVLICIDDYKSALINFKKCGKWNIAEQNIIKLNHLKQNSTSVKDIDSVFVVPPPTIDDPCILKYCDYNFFNDQNM